MYQKEYTGNLQMENDQNIFFMNSNLQEVKNSILSFNNFEDIFSFEIQVI